MTGPRTTQDTLEVVLVTPGGVPGGRKRIRVNGVPRRANTLATTFRTVLFAPEDMSLVVGAPSLRRSSIDTLVAQLVPAAAASMTTYARTLVQRNNLLRRIREEAAARDELRFWDETLVTEGGRIVTWRSETLARLAGPLADAHGEIAPGEGRLTVGSISNAPCDGGEDCPDGAPPTALETAKEGLWNGATHVGARRDDIAFRLDVLDLAGLPHACSRRTAILAWKLAQPTSRGDHG